MAVIFDKQCPFNVFTVCRTHECALWGGKNCCILEGATQQKGEELSGVKFKALSEKVRALDLLCEALSNQIDELENAKEDEVPEELKKELKLMVTNHKRMEQDLKLVQTQVNKLRLKKK